MSITLCRGTWSKSIPPPHPKYIKRPIIVILNYLNVDQTQSKGSIWNFLQLKKEKLHRAKWCYVKLRAEKTSTNCAIKKEKLHRAKWPYITQSPPWKARPCPWALSSSGMCCLQIVPNHNHDNVSPTSEDLTPHSIIRPHIIISCMQPEGYRYILDADAFFLLFFLHYKYKVLQVQSLDLNYKFYKCSI